MLCVNCDHPNPALCRLLKRPMTAHMIELFNQPEYREKWLREAGIAFTATLPPRVRRIALPCLHETGKILSRCEQEEEKWHVRECAIHGPCIRERGRQVGARLCAECDDFTCFPTPTIRHLLYHIYPLRGSFWKERLQALRRKLPLFNGKKIVAIAHDHTTENPEAVEAVLGSDCEFIRIRNNPSLREVETFLPLFESLASLHGSEHCTLFAHAKGVTRGGSDFIQKWVQTLEELHLDYWPVIEKQLTKYACTGAFKKLGRGWSDHESRSDWHYSGSWFWFRNKQLFTQPDWRRIDQFWSGIEPYPSLHFSSGDAGSIFMEDIIPRINLYSSEAWQRISPLLDQWRNGNVAMRTIPGREELRIELGGGTIPREGFINVDRSPPADVVFDLETLDGQDVKLPFDDDSVAELYTSHCLEHIRNLVEVYREILRVCRVGATVEIRVPHPHQQMAMCHDHKQTIGIEQVKHWCETAVAYWSGSSNKKLSLIREEYARGSAFDFWKRMLPQASDSDILAYCPDACHESLWVFAVEARS